VLPPAQNIIDAALCKASLGYLGAFLDCVDCFCVFALEMGSMDSIPRFDDPARYGDDRLVLNFPVPQTWRYPTPLRLSIRRELRTC
jgi:hypothetical protein